MSIDPSIPLGAHVPQYATFNPGAAIQDLAQIQESQVRLQEARRRSQENMEIQRLAAQYPDDPDAFVAALQRINPERGAILASHLENARADHYRGINEQLEGEKRQYEIAARLLQATGGDPDAYGVVRDAYVQKDPQLGAILVPKEQLTPQKFQDILALGETAHEWLTRKQDGVKLFAEGKFREGLGSALSVAPNIDVARTTLQEAGQDRRAAADVRLFSSILDTAPDFDTAKRLFAEASMTPKERGELAKGSTAQGSDFAQYLDTVARTKGVTRQQLTPADILAARKAFGQADDRPRVSVSVAGGGGAGDLSPEGIEYAATQYRLTGKMPPLGMGRTPARAQIINAAAKQAKDLGQSPVASIQRQAAYSGDSKALSRMQTMAASAEAFETKALGQAQIVEELSAKVPRTFSPLINRALLTGQSEIAGDKDVQSLYNAIQTFTTEYAKIMTGSTNSAAASTDSARKEAANLLSAAMSKGSLKQQVALMRREMALTMQGYDATIAHISDRMQGNPSAPSDIGAAASSPAAPAGKKRFQILSVK